MDINKEIWMPHPAHFICAKDCRFHLATYINGVIVSTVGELWFDGGSRRIHAKIYDPEWHEKNNHLLGDTYDATYFKRFGYEELHIGGWIYETMVFSASKSPKAVGELCCPYRINVSDVKHEDWYKGSNEAFKGHYKLVKKYRKK